MRAIPELTFNTIKRMEDMSYFTHALIFDDLVIVAQKETAQFHHTQMDSAHAGKFVECLQKKILKEKEL